MYVAFLILCSLSTALDASLVSLGLTYAISLTVLFQYCIKLGAEVESIVSCRIIHDPNASIQPAVSPLHPISMIGCLHVGAVGI